MKPFLGAPHLLGDYQSSKQLDQLAHAKLMTQLMSSETPFVRKEDFKKTLRVRVKLKDLGAPLPPQCE